MDLQSGELRKAGMKIKLHGQPFEVLAILLERPGEVITRQEFQQRLWAADTFVDFEHGLNKAINRLREALGDEADNPRFIETLPRRGYRFIAPEETKLAQTDATSEQRSGQSALLDSIKNAATLHGSNRPPARATKPILIATTSLLLLAGLIAYWQWTRRAVDKDDKDEERRSPEVTLTPFTSFKGQEISPAFSPDGSQIVFAWDGGNSDGANRFDLYVKVVGSESLLRLTFRPAAWLVPAWSPDGRTIAFVRMSDQGSGIFSVPAIGGPERKLADAIFQFAPGLSLSWSPDGSKLVYSASRNSGLRNIPGSMRILSVEKGEIRQVSSPPQCIYSFSGGFSPDGKWLAFYCGITDGLTSMFVMPSGGGEAHPVTTMAGNPTSLAWSRDSTRIIFSKEYSSDLWEVGSQGGKTNALLFARDASQPAVAPQGHRLAYVNGREIVNLWGLDVNGGARFARKLLVSSTRAQRGPDISPDGKRIVFESNRSGWQEIWVSDFDGSNPVQLSNFHSLTGTARWSPGGQRIVCDSKESGVSALYLVDPHEAVPRKIPLSLPAAAVPSWSRDGRWIYFTSRLGEANQEPIYKIYKTSSHGGDSILVSNTPGFNVQEASDGSLYFAAAVVDAEIHVIPVAGKERALSKMPHLRDPTDFVLGANGIFFLDRTRGRAALSFFDFASAKVRRLAELGKQPPLWGGIAISPDRRWIVYAQTDEKESDIMLAENYR